MTCAPFHNTETVRVLSAQGQSHFNSFELCNIEIQVNRLKSECTLMVKDLNVSEGSPLTVLLKRQFLARAVDRNPHWYFDPLKEVDLTHFGVYQLTIKVSFQQFMTDG